MDGTAAGYAVTGIAERVVAGGGVAEDAEVEVAEVGEAAEVVAAGDRVHRKKEGLGLRAGAFDMSTREQGKP